MITDICITPILKLGVSALLFKITAGIIEPITDKRIVGIISNIAGGISLLFMVVFPNQRFAILSHFAKFLLTFSKFDAIIFSNDDSFFRIRSFRSDVDEKYPHSGNETAVFEEKAAAE